MEVPLLVSPAWLREHSGDPGVQIIENPWSREGYDRAHLVGAIRVPGHPYFKQMRNHGEPSCALLAVDAFRTLCAEIGIRRGRHYIVYDDYFGLFATRLWWVFRYFGVHNCSVLDGSWRGWLSCGFPVTSAVEAPAAADTDIEPQENLSLRIEREEFCDLIGNPLIQIWDTRRPGEFAGTEESDNLRSGHVPGALNLVWTNLLTEPAFPGGPRFLRPKAELEAQLDALGLSREKTIVTYCQSGIRAAFCLFVLELLGFPAYRLYDASMVEWANGKETPLVLGA